MCKNTKTARCCHKRTNRSDSIANAILTPFVYLVAVPVLVIDLIAN